ncbi:MAG: hypothetical protein L6R38_006111 [Xanthoria sp. 2 TBL-2021]|nr:MAG: hypothetical protein L6R38_006111 [Xanthoria sp. 2 TBL-2021]
MEVANPAQTTTDDQPLFKKRNAKKASNVRKRPATPPPADSDSSGYSSTSDDEGGSRIKRRRKTAAVTATSTTLSKSTSTDLSATKFAGDRSSQIKSTNDATKQSNWFDENETTTKNLLGTTRARPSSTTTTSQDTGATAEPNDTYKGQSSYQSFIQKNPNALNRTVGPVKAPTNIRTITVTDFAPDVCKDYKQTGFCGFGDSCKFLHAREDYKQGWELDKDWEIGTKGKKGGMGGKNITAMNKGKGDEEEEEDAMLEGIPFACIICKKGYTNPIVTKCGHYFCEGCALMRYRKSPSCAACGAGTGGVFNGAKGLKRLLDKKRDRARKRREKALAEGKEVDEDDEEIGEDEDGS